MAKSEVAWMMLGIFLLGVFVGVAASCIVVMESAKAEEDIVYSCWAICDPESDVLIREGPGKKYSICGAASCGQHLWTDWQEKNGWIHIVDLNNEIGEGWINEGYIVFDEPERVDCEMKVTGGRRIACRKCINGKLKKWAKSGSTVFVYIMTDEWSVTDKGYIRTKYLKEVSDNQ